jgi:ABC-type uncharacterized transport system fused permease/ATPase subunit
MLTLLARFRRLLAPCINAPGGKASLVLFALAVALNLGAVYASIRLTRWTGEFYSAVEKVDAAQVYRQIGIFALVVGLNSARGLAHEYIRKVIELRWRRSLTDHAIELCDLVSVPTLALAPGGTIWLKGRSGVGKTTLVKTLAGLWQHRSGIAQWPVDRSMFLSQKPYMPNGTLLDAAVYPAHPEGVEESQAVEVLHAVGLSHRSPSLLVAQDDAPDGLSGGEVQRLALARLLIHKPLWVVMDEATSALDERSDRQLLSLLRAKLPNTAFLIISHRRPKGMGDFMTVDLSQPPIRNRP